MGCDYYSKEIIVVHYKNTKLELDFIQMKKGYLGDDEYYCKEKIVKNFGIRTYFSNGEWINDKWKKLILENLTDTDFISITSYLDVWKRI